MIKIDRQNLLAIAIELYGKNAQIDMAIEECSELIKALLKDRRLQNNPNKDYKRENKTHTPQDKAIYNILEEIADVQIMLDQMRAIYGSTENIELEKLERLQNRMNDSVSGVAKEEKVLKREDYV